MQIRGSLSFCNCFAKIIDIFNLQLQRDPHHVFSVALWVNYWNMRIFCERLYIFRFVKFDSTLWSNVSNLKTSFLKYRLIWIHSIQVELDGKNGFFQSWNSAEYPLKSFFQSSKYNTKAILSFKTSECLKGEQRFGIIFGTFKICVVLPHVHNQIANSHPLAVAHWHVAKKFLMK